MLGRIVEIHLSNGKRFLGKVEDRDGEGVMLYCIPLDALDTVALGSDVRGQLKTMLGTLYFPYCNVEYIDVGGEPLGFDHLFAGWFGSRPIAEFFRREDDDDDEPTATGA